MSLRPALASVLVVAALAGADCESAGAHAGLTATAPLAGASLGASPGSVRLTFSEQPAPTLSSIAVLDTAGQPHQSGPPRGVGGRSLAVGLPQLPRGVYTVNWRAVSAVDGHATSGTYAFGVGATPTGAAAVAHSTTPSASALEIVARWILLVGVALLLGATVAGAAGFGGATGSDVMLAGAGWTLAAGGLIALAAAQTRAADSSLGDLLDTSVGRALIWRAVALVAAGVAVLVARRMPSARRVALGIAAGCAGALIVIHVAAGHAAATSWPRALPVAAQSAHFGAAGVWLGGLAALLLGVRGAESADKVRAVGRFSAVAAVGLVVVAATGTLRAIDELSSVGELFSTGYGRAIVAKIVLLAAIATFGLRNRRRSVPAASTDLGPLRRTSRGELTLAAAALAAAAVLGSLAPPVSVQAAAPPGVSDSGSDFASTVHVKLTAASADPGPNRFVARVEDADSGALLRDAAVRLRFTPLDDPGVDPTSLTLRRGADGTYAASGSNLAFDGRWGVSVLVQRGANSVEVPLELDARGPDQFISIARIPGQAPTYSMQVGSLGFIRLSPDPERAGPSTVHVTVYDVFENETPVDQIVLTAAAGDGPVRQQALRRLSAGSFAARMRLAEGPMTFTVVARVRGGGRLRGVFDLEIPG